MEYSLNHNSWFGGKPVKITLPDAWSVTYCGMTADGCPELTREDIEKRINMPFGSRSITELAEGKRDVCIVFDDMSRGTPCKDMAEIIIEQLRSAGIKKEQIRFICATGSHSACNRIDFEKKLGSYIVKNYAVFNHNPFQNCRNVGTTSGGVELHINEELMRCDLKIGIGSISPHPVNGFGGGGKLIIIGTAGMETIHQLHTKAAECASRKKLGFTSGIGNLELDGMRTQIEEAVEMVGLDFKVDAILDSGCRIVECTAGHPNVEYYKGCELSGRLNRSDKLPEGMDVVIANANVKANEAAIALSVASAALKPSGGALVLVDHTPMGQVNHQYSGASGYYTGGPAYRGIADRFPGVDKVIFYSPFPDVASAISFGDNRRILFAETWSEVMEYLSVYGAGTKAAVLSDATIMAF